MNAQIICIPLNADGTIHDRLGKANTVAICKLEDGQVSDWTEHVVEWDTTYGVDVMGVHHPRIMRFMQDQKVDAVVADNVCDVIQRSLPNVGVTVHPGFTGDARSVVASAMAVPAA